MSEILHEELPNGLHIIGEPNSWNRSCSIGFFVKTGARDESKKEAGVSHFLEHMVFKGTEKRGALDITFEMGNLGAQANAYTSEETTVFYASMIPESLPPMFELLSDMMRPKLDRDEYDMEKKVILEEIALYEDKPQFWLFERAFADFFGDHPCGQSVLGTHDSIRALGRDDMADYLNRRYSSNNMVLVVTGRFDWNAFLAQARDLCGGWKTGSTSREKPPFHLRASNKLFRRPNLSQAYLLSLTEAPSAQCAERYPLTLLSYITGDSSGSRMYWDLVHTGLAESAGADLDERDATGCLLGYAVTEVERADEVRERMRTILNTPLEYSEADLRRAKEKLLSKVVLSGEVPVSRLMALGNSWLYRQETLSLREVKQKIQSITRQDIEKALQKYPLKTWCEYTLLPEMN
jgi:predicted Zn-dependent peptidase